jgi:hypothetical protein
VPLPIQTTEAHAGSLQTWTLAWVVPATGMKRSSGRFEVTTIAFSGPIWRGAGMAHDPYGVSQPFMALPSQLLKPALQVNEQLVPPQVDVAFARAGQTLPQDPQFVTVLTVVSQPLALLRSQSPNPGAHAVMMHREVTQAVSATLVSRVHRVLQLPQ